MSLETAGYGYFFAVKIKIYNLKKFAFDLDGTITKVETLPILARELGLSAQMKFLTDLTLAGKIPFEKSFRLRYEMLKKIPLKKITEIMRNIELDEEIFNFIRENKNICAVVTGNLDCWVEPVAEKLGCEIFSSTSELDAQGVPVLKKILRKDFVISQLKNSCEKVIAIGESFNDVPMFEAADISIAYGGVHKPVDAAVFVADFVVNDSQTLCRLLKNL
ncbi:MAG: HAD family phosphatase [Selenomonadaceae bacterium]|nr:HAD family phosphatase [Selenomonadaceae bacterium]